MEAKHTPGPWKAYRFSDKGGVARIAIVGAQPSSLIVAKTCAAEGEDEANARLIAAAPELLEALRGLLQAESPDYVQSWGIAREQALAAVAKATGKDL